MPFDEEELDPHGECAAEIKQLRDCLSFILSGIERGNIKDASLVIRGQEDLGTLSGKIRTALHLEK